MPIIVQSLYCAIICVVISPYLSVYGQFFNPFQFLVDRSNALMRPFIMDAPNEVDEESQRGPDPEATMSVFEIIRYHGYTAEQYDVMTQDGYILTIQRIPYGKDGPSFKPRKPVILQHGLLCSSAIWVINPPDKNFAYMLADAGYDVWLTNVRGNTYGRRHKKGLFPNDKDFWLFSFDQMAQFDMPAIIDFVLKKTGFSQTHYIGHSMGTTIPFAMLSTQPQYNNKLRSLMALAPVGIVTKMRSPIRLLESFVYDISSLLGLLGEHEFLPNNDLIKIYSETICSSPVKQICSNPLFAIAGYDPMQFNMTRLPVYLHHTPAGTSTQNIAHYVQLLSAKRMQHYDYGATENRRRYGQTMPPEYNVSKITTPVALFWSDNDILADPEDVKLLSQKLKNLVLNYRVPFDEFSHLDFMWAIDGKILLYNKVIELLKKLWDS